MIEINLEQYLQEDSRALTQLHNAGAPQLSPNKKYILHAPNNLVVALNYSYFEILFKGWSPEQIGSMVLFDLNDFLKEQISEHIERLERNIRLAI